mgnify:FL=1
MNAVKLGISIYSFAKEFYTGEYGIGDCIRRVADMGLDGIEIVGSQMVRGYPWPSDETIDDILGMCDRHGVKLICYSSNSDFGIRSDRDLTEEELFEYGMHDLRAAARFGAKVMRVQYLMTAPVMARLAPHAERLGIRVGVEMHSPESPSTPTMQRFLKMFREVGSPNLGFVVDFGSFADKPNRFVVEKALRDGAHPEIVAYMTRARYEGMPRGEVQTAAVAMGANDADLGLLSVFYSFTAFQKPDWTGLAEIMPHVVHCHGKFYALDPENGDLDVSIPYDRILPLLRDNGFDGYIMSEYESMDPERDTFDLLRRHTAMEARILAST